MRPSPLLEPTDPRGPVSATHVGFFYTVVSPNSKESDHVYTSTRTNHYMRRHLVLIAASIVACLAPDSAGGQATDSLPFRPRQWGTEFSLGSSFSSVGLVRFLSSQHALLLDFGGSLERASANRTNAPYLASDRTDLRLRVGPRWYRPVAPRVARYVSAGLTTSLSHVRFDVDSVLRAQGYAGEQRGTGLGAFGEIGALWFVTNHLSLGASWNATLEFRRDTDERQDARVARPQQVENRVDRTTLAFGQIAMRGALYF